MRQAQKNGANNNCDVAAIGCQAVGVANSPAAATNEVKRKNRSERNSRSCLVDRRLWSQRVGGFTLIELLVVIALVALLLGLLIPCLHVARKKATQVRCLSNLKALGMAVQLYANDHAGLFPTISDDSQITPQVRQALQPYAKAEEIFCCPDDPEKPTPPGGSYDWRLTHDPKASLSNVRLPLIKQANRVIIGGDRSAGWHKPDMINVILADSSARQVTEEYWWENITRPLQR
jgi:prepilin-type N-terminal cleavage/methylation domain-containing protein